MGSYWLLLYSGRVIAPNWEIRFTVLFDSNHSWLKRKIHLLYPFFSCTCSRVSLFTKTKRSFFTHLTVWINKIICYLLHISSLCGYDEADWTVAKHVTMIIYIGNNDISPNKKALQNLAFFFRAKGIRARFWRKKNWDPSVKDLTKNYLIVSDKTCAYKEV